MKPTNVTDASQKWKIAIALIGGFWVLSYLYEILKTLQDIRTLLQI